MQRAAILKRLQQAGTKAAGQPVKEIRRLLAKMTTEELREIAGDDITPERLREIMERVKKV